MPLIVLTFFLFIVRFDLGLLQRGRKMIAPSIKELEAVFFDAMNEGWASGVQHTTNSLLPGAHIIEWNKRGYLVIDCYYVNNGKNVGWTMMWCNDVPVWVMNYHGEYPTSVVPFLKRALMESYGNRQFFGGRGPALYKEGNLCYFNNHAERTFGKFHGIERIFDMNNNTSLGWHEYSGFTLI